MGYTTEKHTGGTITRFWPDDDDNTIYLAHNTSLEEILDAIKKKWPNSTASDISIAAEYIH